MQQPEQTNAFAVRRATVADAAVIALHRASMFLDMGSLVPDASAELQTMTIAYMERALRTGEYVGFLAFDTSAAETIVGGAGLLLRQTPPFPLMHGPLAGTIASGRQALVMNVYVQDVWRRRGLARLLMQSVLAFAEADRIESLVLHASKAGRPLYEQLGFIATNEMRFVPPSSDA